MTEPDRMIQLLAPELDIPHAAADPTGPAADDLLRRVMSAPSPTPRRKWGPRLAVGGSLAAGLAAAVVAASVWLPESSPGGPTPARAAALRITTGGTYLEIRILDPAADPRRYREELAARGLDIDLALAPAASDEVGRVIFEEESSPGIEPVEAPGNCTANGNCGVGVRVPLAYHGHARIVFGRTPRPGESVEGDAPVLSSGQQAQLRALVGKNVSDARRQLAENGQTASYRIIVSESIGEDRRQKTSLDVPASQVPGTWIVYDVAPLAGDVVVIWASADGKPPTR
ncbi:hypothetical protein DMB66_03325 [Actinoplanes sp. ATCC 53533]|uniref:hypothetical protein n=1 Tax=Actinoplanes sp. ATCC 53533 TaxID=1288362 RepID=UPI000F77BBF1|nr:hypothetical protein [Actinoplanes sp. ATCC 53533]RSM73092.1 hypothetical protein DMB66_03325 [Actinoplanes sp. ATCC 53533]